MKKVLCFAAAAMTLFAACQKTTVVYDNSEPQEIAVFAVNKTATKAPVEGAEFPSTYAMQVASYLAAGDDVEPGNYFDGTTFSKGASYWAGGKYWPVSAATLNFLAVAPQVKAVATAGETTTATVVTTFGTPATAPAEGDGTSAANNFIGKSTTVVANNEARQYDVMYAVSRATKLAGFKPTQVGMEFKHAYSWLDFKFKTGNTTGTNAPTITINKVTVNNVATDGTLTVSVTNGTSDAESMSTTQAWSAYTAKNIEVPVPVAETQTSSVAETAFTLTSTSTEYKKGLLLIPESPMTSFVIDYTVTVGGDSHKFTYTHKTSTTTGTSNLTWAAGKKYTYEITMTLSEIEVSPTVSTWEDYDADEDKDDNQPIEVNTNTTTTTTES